MFDSSECQNDPLKGVSQRTSCNDASSQAAGETTNRTPLSAQGDGPDTDQLFVVGCGANLCDGDDDPFGNPGIYMHNCMDFVSDGGDYCEEGEGSDDVKPWAPVSIMNISSALNGMEPTAQQSNSKGWPHTTVVRDILQGCSLPIQEGPLSIENVSTTSDTFLHSFISSHKSIHDRGSFVDAPNVVSLPFNASHGSNTNSSDVVNCKMDDAVRSNLFVSGLHSCATDVDLYTLFSSFGKIESSKVMLDIHTGKSRSIAFVKYEDVACAKKAVDALNGSTFMGEVIAVRVAKPHAAYRPGAPTNRTFVRNVPLSLKKADLVTYFGAFGEVMDVSIHSDTALRSSDKRRNIAFITYNTKEEAARAAQETHTKTAFPDCDGIPLLAKVAEDSAHRIERLARRGGPCSGGAPHSSATAPPHGHTFPNNNNNSMRNINNMNNSNSSNNGPNVNSAVPMDPMGTAAGVGPTEGMAPQGFAFAPGLPPQVLAGPFASAPAAFYPAPFYPVAPGPGRAAPFFFVDPKGGPAAPVFTMPPPPHPHANTNTSANRSTNTNNSFIAPIQAVPAAARASGQQQGTAKQAAAAAAAAAAPMFMYPGEGVGAYPAMMATAATFMYYLPNGQVALAAAPLPHHHQQQQQQQAAASQRVSQSQQKFSTITQVERGQSNEGKRKGR